MCAQRKAAGKHCDQAMLEETSWYDGHCLNSFLVSTNALFSVGSIVEYSPLREMDDYAAQTCERMDIVVWSVMFVLHLV